jgi:hypothetical protein
MEYLKALLELAYRLGYDGLPPGEDGPVILASEINNVTLEVEEYIVKQLQYNIQTRRP